MAYYMEKLLSCPTCLLLPKIDIFKFQFPHVFGWAKFQTKIKARRSGCKCYRTDSFFVKRYYGLLSIKIMRPYLSALVLAEIVFFLLAQNTCI